MINHMYVQSRNSQSETRIYPTLPNLHFTLLHYIFSVVCFSPKTYLVLICADDEDAWKMTTNKINCSLLLPPQVVYHLIKGLNQMQTVSYNMRNCPMYTVFRVWMCVDADSGDLLETNVFL